MGTDRTEQNRRGQSATKTTTIHRYAAIEHRVIDSPAFADLTFSAKSLLLLMARQLSRDNNGHLQAAHSYMKDFGYCDKTLTRATKELVEHGFLYRTRMGGYQKGASQYAVTWLPIKRREGLTLDWFMPCAWRKWEPSEKKSPPTKLRSSSRKNVHLPTDAQDIFTAEVRDKSTDIETVPVVVLYSAQQARHNRPRKQPTSPFAIRLTRTADRGHLRLAA